MPSATNAPEKQSNSTTPKENGRGALLPKLKKESFTLHITLAMQGTGEERDAKYLADEVLRHTRLCVNKDAIVGCASAEIWDSTREPGYIHVDYIEVSND